MKDWATVTQFMSGSIGYVVQEPHVTGDFKQFFIIMNGSNCGKRVLADQTMIVEQVNALLTGYGKQTSSMKRAWLNQFNFWTPSQLRAQLRVLAESEGFLEIE